MMMRKIIFASDSIPVVIYDRLQPLGFNGSIVKQRSNWDTIMAVWQRHCRSVGLAASPRIAKGEATPMRSVSLVELLANAIV
jgi:hypothetical protein